MILNRQRAVRVRRRPLEEFLRRVEHGLGIGGADVTVCLVSDREIARMNEAFRKKKGPTDVLSFPADGRPTARAKKRKTIYAHGTEKKRADKKSPVAGEYLGDIAIAPETARRFAKKNGRRLQDELCLLVLHGVLHLLGYDHETDDGKMNRIENAMRRRFGLS